MGSKEKQQVNQRIEITNQSESKEKQQINCSAKKKKKSIRLKVLKLKIIRETWSWRWQEKLEVEIEVKKSQEWVLLSSEWLKSQETQQLTSDNESSLLNFMSCFASQTSCSDYKKIT